MQRQDNNHQCFYDLKEYNNLHSHFVKECTRNSLLDDEEQEKLFQYLHDRQIREIQQQNQQQQQQKSSNKLRSKTVSVMNNVEEMLFMYRVLTQSITAKHYNNIEFAVMCYEKCAELCIRYNNMKQLFVCLMKLVTEIYPAVVRRSSLHQYQAQEEACSRMQEFTSYYILFSIGKDIDQQLLSNKRDQSEILHISSELYKCGLLMNYKRFFQLIDRYKGQFPDCWFTLLNNGLTMDDMRLVALKLMQKSYYSLPSDYVSQMLLFPSPKHMCEWWQSTRECNERMNRSSDQIVSVVSFDEEMIVFKNLPGRR